MLTRNSALTTKGGQKSEGWGDFDHTPEQVQKAKDFIWEYLEPHNKGLILLHANTDNLKDNDLGVKKIVIGFEYNLLSSLCTYTEG